MHKRCGAVYGVTGASKDDYCAPCNMASGARRERDLRARVDELVESLDTAHRAAGAAPPAGREAVREPFSERVDRTGVELGACSSTYLSAGGGAFHYRRTPRHSSRTRPC